MARRRRGIVQSQSDLPGLIEKLVALIALGLAD
jgi:hypothetical protein